MKIRFIEVGSTGDEGEHYRFEAEIDVADADEAYVKGREFERLTYALSRGSRDEQGDRAATRERDEGDET